MADQSETNIFGVDKLVKEAENQKTANLSEPGSPFGEQSSTTAGFSGFPDLSDLSALDSGTEFWSPWSPSQEPVQENNSKPLVGDLFSSLTLDTDKDTASGVSKNVSETDGDSDQADSRIGEENNPISQSSLVDVSKSGQCSTPMMAQSSDDVAELDSQSHVLGTNVEKGSSGDPQEGVKEQAIDMEKTTDEIEASETSNDLDEPESADEFEEAIADYEQETAGYNKDPETANNVEKADTEDEMKQPEIADDVQEPESTDNIQEPEIANNVEEADTDDEIKQPEIADDVQEPASTDDIQEPETANDVQEPESTDDIQEPNLDILHPTGSTNKEKTDQHLSRPIDEEQVIGDCLVQTAGEMEEERDQNISPQSAGTDTEHGDQNASVQDDVDQTMGVISESAGTEATNEEIPNQSTVDVKQTTRGTLLGSERPTSDKDKDQHEDKIGEQDHEIHFLSDSDIEETTKDSPNQIGSEQKVSKSQKVIEDKSQSSISDLEQISKDPMEMVEEQNAKKKIDDKLERGTEGQVTPMEVEDSTPEESTDQSKTKPSESAQKSTEVPDVECIDISSDEEAPSGSVGHKTLPTLPVSRNIVMNSAKGVEKVIGTASIDTGGEKVDMQECKNTGVTVFFVKKDIEKEGTPITTSLGVEGKSKEGAELSGSNSNKTTDVRKSNTAGNGVQSNQGQKSNDKNVPKQGSSGPSEIGNEIKALMMANKSKENVSKDDDDDDIIIDEVIGTPRIGKTVAPKNKNVSKSGNIQGSKITNIKNRNIAHKPKSGNIPKIGKRPGRPRKPGPISPYLKKKREARQKEALQYKKSQLGIDSRNIEDEDADTTSSLAMDVESHPDEMMQSIVQSCATTATLSDDTQSKSMADVPSTSSMTDVPSTSSAGVSNLNADANDDVITLDVSEDEDKEEKSRAIVSKVTPKSRKKGKEGDSEEDLLPWQSGQCKCDYCAKTFLSFASYSRHVVTHFNLKPFLCRFCEQMFSDSSTLVKHLRVRHLVAVEKSRDFVCSYCKKSYNGPQRLLRHVMTHTGKTLPTKNSKPLSKKEKMRELKERKRELKKKNREMEDQRREKKRLEKLKRQPKGVTVTIGAESESAKKTVEASDCEETVAMETEEVDAVEADEAVSLDDLPECAKMFDCSQCDISCNVALVFIEHVKTQHSSKIQLQCPMCSTIFVKISSFVSHLKFQKCTRGEEFFCGSCEFQGEDATDLAEHVMNIHTLCHLCKKEFGQLELLQRHLTSHLKIRPFKCNICSKEYGDSLSYIKHMVAEHPKSGVDYQCYKCQVYFSRAAELTRHFFQHVTLEDFEADPSSTQHKADQCATCHHVYRSAEEAKIHICKTGAMYRCINASCSFKTNIEASFKLHVKACPTLLPLSKTIMPLTPAKTVSTDAQGSTPPKKIKVFRCTKCNFISSDTNAHVQHVMTKHNAKNIQYQCHVCKMLFTSPKDLVQHIEMHRGKSPKKATSEKPSIVTISSPPKILKIVSSTVQATAPSSKPGITILTSQSPIRSPVRRTSSSEQQQSSTLASTVIQNLSNLAQADSQSQPVVSTSTVDYTKMPALGAITKMSQLANQQVSLVTKSMPQTINVLGGTWPTVGSVASAGNTTTSVSSLGNIIQSSTTLTNVSSGSTPAFTGNKQVLYVKNPNAQGQKNNPLTCMLPPRILLPSLNDKDSMLQRALTLPPIVAPTGTNIQLRIMAYPSQPQSGSNTTTTVTPASVAQSMSYATMVTQASMAQSTSYATTMTQASMPQSTSYATSVTRASMPQSTSYATRVTQASVSQSMQYATTVTQASLPRLSTQSISSTATILTQANQGRAAIASMLAANSNATLSQRSILGTHQVNVQPHSQPNTSTQTAAAAPPMSEDSDTDSSSSYEDHRFVRIKEEPVSDNEDMSNKEKYKCDLCQIEFVDASALENHQTLLHSNKEECTSNRKEALGGEASTSRNDSNSDDSDSDNMDVGFHYTVSDSDGEDDDAANKAKASNVAYIYEGGRKVSYNKCRYENCNKVFRGSHNLYRHMCVHTKIAPYQCHQCKQKFTDSSYYVKHVRISHQAEQVTYSCQFCGLNRIKSPRDLIEHMTTSHQQFRESTQFYVCVHCNCLVLHAKHLQNHIRTVHDRPGLSHCYFCKKTFTQSIELPLHLHLTHLPEFPFQCVKCPFKTAQVPSFVAHMEKEHKIFHKHITYTCSICLSSYYKSGDLIQHELIHSGQTVNMQEACRDELTVTPSGAEGESIEDQVEGHEKHKKHKKHSKHKKKDRMEMEQTVPPKVTPPKVPPPKVPDFVCNFCFQEFPNKELLHLHIWDHNAVKPYRCYKCNEEFSVVENYTKHIEGFHHCRLKFVCFLCKKSFTQWAHLLSHYSEKHGKGVISCCSCPRTFDSLDRLNRHFLTHNSDDLYESNQPPKQLLVSTERVQSVPEIPSPQVAKTVPVVKTVQVKDTFQLEKTVAKAVEREMKTDQLKNEQEQPSASQESLLSCRFCGKQFAKHHQILRHEKIHYKPFVCNIRWCLKRFGEKCQLEKHERTTHKGKCCDYCVSSFRTVKELNDHQTIHKNIIGNGYSCVYCTRSFESFDDLVLHSDVILPKYTNMSCYICKETLTLPCQMLVHQEIHQANKHCKIKCNFCGSSHYSIIDFNKHRKAKHGVSSLLDMNDIIVSDSTGDKECHFCFRICHTPKRMKIHLMHDHSVNDYLALCMTKTLWGNIDSEKLKEQIGSVPQMPANFKLTGDDYDEEDDEYEDDDDDDDDESSGGLTCKFCSAKFTDVSLLKTHEAAHSGKAKNPTSDGLTCKFCSAKFTDVGLLKTHEAAHSGKKMYPAASASSSQGFATQKELQEHTIAHVRTNIGQDTTKSDANRGVAKDTPKSNADISQASSKVNRDIDQESSKTVASKEVSKEVVDSTKSEEGMTQDDDDDDSDDDGGDIMDFTQSLEDDDEDEDLESEKEEEKKDSDGQKQLEEPKKKFACPFCDVKSSSKQNLMKHIMSHAGQEVKHGGKLNVKVQMSFKCDQCSASFKYREMLKKHKRKHFHEEGLIYKCSVCSKEFNHMAKYYQHKMAAHSKKDTGFGTKHKRSVGRPRKFQEAGKHGGQNVKAVVRHDGTYVSYFKYSCKGCGRKFRKVKRLHEHQAQCHKFDIKTGSATEDTEQESNQEGASTSETDVKSLSSNKNLTAGKKPARPSGYIGISATSSVARGWIYPHKCKQCSALFRKKKALDRHMIHMHIRLKNPQIKPGETSKLQGSSRDRDKTLTRIKKTSESKPWKCGQCGEGFFREVSLLRHLPVHKAEEPVEEVGKHVQDLKTEKHEMTRSTGDVKATSNVLANKQSKQKELPAKTSGDLSKPYKCDTCGERFFREVSLLRHLPMHDKEIDKQEQTKELQASITQEKMITVKPDLSKSLDDVSARKVSPNRTFSSNASKSRTIKTEPATTTKRDDEIQIPDEVKHQLYDISIPVIKSINLGEELKSFVAPEDGDNTDDESTMSSCTDESFRSSEDKTLDTPSGGLSSVPEQSGVWIYKYYCQFCQAPFAKYSVYRKHLRKHTRKNKSKKKQGGEQISKGQRSDNIGTSQEVDSTVGSMMDDVEQHKKDEAQASSIGEKPKDEDSVSDMKDSIVEEGVDEKLNEKTEEDGNVALLTNVSESAGNSNEQKNKGLEGDEDTETGHEENTTSPNEEDLPGTSSSGLSKDTTSRNSQYLCENEADKSSVLTPLTDKPSETILEDGKGNKISEENLLEEEVVSEKDKEFERRDTSEVSVSPSSKRPAQDDSDDDDIEILSDDGISPCKKPRGTALTTSSETEVSFASSDFLDSLEMIGGLDPSSEESTPVKSSPSTADADGSIKRGRGRPRKYPIKDLPPKPLIKRGRGRPPGTFRVKKSPQLPKRPRGRPFKSFGPGVSPVRSPGSPAKSPVSYLSNSPSRSRAHSEELSGGLSDSMLDENRIGMILDSLEPEDNEEAPVKVKDEVFEVDDVLVRKDRLELDEKETKRETSKTSPGIYGFSDSIDDSKASTSTQKPTSEIQSPPIGPHTSSSQIPPATSTPCSEMLSIQIQSPTRRSPTSPRMRSPPTSPTSPTMRLHSPPRKILFKGGNIKIEAVNVKKKSPSPEIEIVHAKKQLSPDPVCSVYDFDEDDGVKSKSRKRKSKKKGGSTPSKKKSGNGRAKDISSSHTERKEKNKPSANPEDSAISGEAHQDGQILPGDLENKPREQKVLEIEDDLDTDATIENYLEDEDSRDNADLSSPKSTNQEEPCSSENVGVDRIQTEKQDVAKESKEDLQDPDKEDSDVESQGTIEAPLDHTESVNNDLPEEDSKTGQEFKESEISAEEGVPEELMEDNPQASTKQQVVKDHRKYSASMEFEDISDPESPAGVEGLKGAEDGDCGESVDQPGGDNIVGDDDNKTDDDETLDHNPQDGSKVADDDTLDQNPPDGCKVADDDAKMDDNRSEDESLDHNPPAGSKMADDDKKIDNNDSEQLLGQNPKIVDDDKTDDNESDDDSISVPDEMEMDYSEIL